MTQLSLFPVRRFGVYLEDVGSLAWDIYAQAPALLSRSTAYRVAKKFRLARVVRVDVHEGEVPTLVVR